MTGPRTPPAGSRPARTYFWSVTAHASCDPTKTTSTSGPLLPGRGGVRRAGLLRPAAPAAGATGIASNPHALVVGLVRRGQLRPLPRPSSTAPPLYLAGALADASLQLSGLVPGATYFWKVVARTSCDPQLIGDDVPVRELHRRRAPARPPARRRIVFVPPAPSASARPTSSPGPPRPGSTPAAATSSSGRPSPRSRRSSTRRPPRARRPPSSRRRRDRSTTASGPSPRCDPPKAGARLGDPVRHRRHGGAERRLHRRAVRRRHDPGRQARGPEDAPSRSRTSGRTPLTRDPRPGARGSSPSSTSSTPTGGRHRLRDARARAAEDASSSASRGRRATRAGTYQGLVVVSAPGAGLAVTPYAFVNLKVGGAATAVPAVPRRRARRPSTPSSRALGGTTTPGGRRSPSTSTTPGRPRWSSAPRSGPRSGSSPEAGWNATPIPPGASRTVRPSRRTAAAPRTARRCRATPTSRSGRRRGRRRRLLVQDNDAVAAGPGRTSLARAGRPLLRRPVRRQRPVGDRQHLRLAAAALQRRDRAGPGRAPLHARTTTDGFGERASGAPPSSSRPTTSSP